MNVSDHVAVAERLSAEVAGELSLVYERSAVKIRQVQGMRDKLNRAQFHLREVEAQLKGKKR